MIAGGNCWSIVTTPGLGAFRHRPMRQGSPLATTWWLPRDEPALRFGHSPRCSDCDRDQFTKADRQRHGKLLYDGLKLWIRQRPSSRATGYYGRFRGLGWSIHPFKDARKFRTVPLGTRLILASFVEGTKHFVLTCRLNVIHHTLYSINPIPKPSLAFPTTSNHSQPRNTLERAAFLSAFSALAAADMALLTRLFSRFFLLSSRLNFASPSLLTRRLRLISIPTSPSTSSTSSGAIGLTGRGAELERPKILFRKPLSPSPCPFSVAESGWEDPVGVVPLGRIAGGRTVPFKLRALKCAVVMVGLWRLKILWKRPLSPSP